MDKVVRVSAEIHGLLREMAFHQGKTMNQIVAELVRNANQLKGKVNGQGTKSKIERQPESR